LYKYYESTYRQLHQK